MKKGLIIFLLLLVGISGIFANEVFAEDKMLLAPGNSALSVGFDFGLGVNAGYEYILGKFDVGEIPLSYGIKALGGATFRGSGIGYFAGGVGTLHFAWASLEFPDNLWWINNIDSFIGFGVGYFGHTASTDRIWLISHGGSNYFFSESMALTFAGGLGGSYVGVLLKL